MQRILRAALVLSLTSCTLVRAQAAPTQSAPPTSYSVSGPRRTSVTAPEALSLRSGASQAMSAVLIVPSQETSSKQTNELSEDLNVMCAVFDKLLADAGVKTRSWGSRPGRYERSSRCIYLPGYGALFLIEVDFPLTAPPDSEPEEGQAPTEDPLWAEVRNSMRSPQLGASYAADGTALQYDSLKVQSLERTLRRTIQHASNVRHLEPAERIVAVAIDSPKGQDVMRAAQINGLFASKAPGSRAGDGFTNILSVRSSKKDVDALANGQLDTAAFEASIEMSRYQVPPLAAEGRTTKPSATFR